MNPVEPIQLYADARRVTYGAGQSDYNTLPAVRYPDGTVHTRWVLTPDERQAILDGACITLSMLTFNQPLQSVHLAVEGVGERVEVPV
jgi:hypothetical protein